ncbi:hypothetical protein SAMN05192574_102658 [Mucilaginibacter gossypiicola]|uniref:Uncharacterized protein n=1 Tax=Mucilaginibacter gossypiicola TaxID=551995 RepID=A0A1H8EC08_9SPHI|nr:hypothetical protein SAMN05192574_102658 [Mucilaginibacter gossypiicola]
MQVGLVKIIDYEKDNKRIDGAFDSVGSIS